jgi:hypothetical protein
VGFRRDGFTRGAGAGLPSRPPSRSGGSVRVPGFFGNLRVYEAMGAMSIGEPPALAECNRSHELRERLRLRNGGFRCEEFAPGALCRLRFIITILAGIFNRKLIVFWLSFGQGLPPAAGPPPPAHPSLPSRSIPAPVYFGIWEVYEAGEARCPSVFEGHLVCACPALFAGKRRSASAGWTAICILNIYHFL